MVIMVREQGEALGKLEDYVNDIDIVIKKAESEIDQAERDSRYNSKKIIWLTITICLVIILVVLVIIVITRIK
jgi:t-SNARE complex subunit (syntaxin)